ncbi:MAG: NADP-dependent isocitrate dehydrogenase [Ignavibacteria bacterium]|jgi:isocitrate dehydrogenase|nr:NADP-dependent isocitrate dehydrogenase [Ignavibacteria bacterium]
MKNIITISNGILHVPDSPVIPYIEGDGIGPDVWKATQKVLDSAVEKAYSGKKSINWLEVFAGEKSFKLMNSWLPTETIDAFKLFKIGMKGPLTTPVGGGIRSLNVALRQTLDLYVCLRPVKYYQGIETPMKHPEYVDMVIFRENTEDIYAGIEFKSGTAENEAMLKLLRTDYPDQFKKIRFGTLDQVNEFLSQSGRETTDKVEVGIGIKVISKVGTERLIIAAIKHAIDHKRKSVTIVHKGNIMKFTDGSFRDWGYDIAETMFADKIYSYRNYEKLMNEKGKDAAEKDKAKAMEEGKILLWDSIMDNTLQQVLTNPKDFDVIATLNLNGDYLSDAIAAQVGGIGISPGSNINYISGHAIFEATHGTAPTFANKDMANPSSLILSGVMMLDYLGWGEAADLVEAGLKKTILSKKVTFDLARDMEGSMEVKCSEFAQEIVNNF